jgi:Protein of unknown function (DUF3631)
VTTAYVRVTSAERESGKSRLLEVLALLVRRGWLAVNASAATVFRKVDQDAPTLLLDEVDQVPFADRRDLLSVLNAGYRLGVKVPRCDERGNLREFEVFCPKAFAGIDDGKLPDTLYSRSVPVRLERRRPDEPIARFRYRTAEPEAEKLTKRLATWAAANLEALVDAEPELPDELGDREAECWEPLLAIADRVGGEWPQRARRAAVALAKERRPSEESSGVELLADLRRVFQEHGDPDALFSADLAADLNAIEESGWGGWHGGEGIRPRDIARVLRPYAIAPHKVRIDERTLQGYRREQFEDAWDRYVRKTGTIGTTGTNATVEPNANPAVEPNVPDVLDVPDIRGYEDADFQQRLDYGDDA